MPNYTPPTTSEVPDGPSNFVEVAEFLIPVATILATARATAPTGFLICDGSAVSRTGVNADLFAAIGTAYGIGDGATTFNIPDLRGRVPVGVDAGVGRVTTINARGQASGSQIHQHTYDIPGHTHTGSCVNHLHDAGSIYAGNHAHHMQFTSGTADNPDGASRASGGFSANNPNHHHSVIGDTWGSGNVGCGGYTGAADRPLNWTTSGPNITAGTTANATALPPYQMVNYMIKR